MEHKTCDETRRNILAQNIKTFVEDSKLSHFEIATRLNITTRQLLRYKNCISEPPATIVYLMSKIFDVDTTRMFMTFEEWIGFIREKA